MSPSHIAANLHHFNRFKYCQFYLSWSIRPVFLVGSSITLNIWIPHKFIEVNVSLYYCIDLIFLIIIHCQLKVLFKFVYYYSKLSGANILLEKMHWDIYCRSSGHVTAPMSWLYEHSCWIWWFSKCPQATTGFSFWLSCFFTNYGKNLSMYFYKLLFFYGCFLSLA